MKRIGKQGLTVLCILALLGGLCLMGPLGSVAEDTASDKWVLYAPFEGANPLTRNFSAGNKVYQSMNTSGVTLPKDTVADGLALYVKMHVDAPALTVLNAGGSFELANNYMDREELSWNTTSVKWTLGVNEVILPFRLASSTTGTVGPLDVTAPIKWFRLYTNQGVESASTVIFYEIAIVDITEAGLLFGGNDTYLQLTKPLAAAPNTIEASVKVDPLASEWTLKPMDGSTSGFSYGATTTYGTVAKGEVGPPEGTSYAAATIGPGYGDGTGRLGFTTTFSLSIPKMYAQSDLAISFWLYTSADGSLPAGEFELTSSGTCDQEEIRWNPGAWELQAGWNYIELPLDSFVGQSGAFDYLAANYLRWYTILPQSGECLSFSQDIRVTDVKLKAVKGPSLSMDLIGDRPILSNAGAEENVIALMMTSSGGFSLTWADKTYPVNGNWRTGEWVDVAAVRDMSAGTIYVYVDGEKAGEFSAAGTEDIRPTTAHCIGADATGAVFEGYIADVRVWSDARTAEEIATGRVAKKGRRDNGLSADTQGLIGSWFLLGDSQNVLETMPDVSKYENTAVFAGSRADDWLDYDQTQYDFLYDEEGNPDYYTMVFIPDIQNLVTGKYTAWWMAEAAWIADNIEKENIVHVVGAGDSTWNNTVGEYNIARAGFDLFTNKVSWSNLIGNHDYVWSATYRETERYNTYFGLDYIRSTKGGENFVGYFEDPYGISEAENAYYRFGVNGVKWMILQLEFHPRTHVLAWANEILAQYPNDNVILTTHSYLNGEAEYCAQSYTYINGAAGNGSGDAAYGGYIGKTPEKVWTDVAYNNPNVKMILCGHSSSDECAIVYREDANVDGTMVPQMMINAQNLDNNDNQTGGYFSDQGIGLLGILRFSADGTQVAMQYYSPYYEKSYSPSSNAITLDLDVQAATDCLHAADREHVTEEATCKKIGTKKIYCKECGIYKRTETIPRRTEHLWDEGAVTKEATNTADGVMTYTCLSCGDTREEPIPATGLLGDADGNGEITSTDARLVLQYYVQKITAEDLKTALVDVDGNGEITSTDARLILQYYVKKIAVWPKTTA